MGKIWGISGPEGTKGGPHENEFWIISNTKIMLQTVTAEKVDEINVVIWLVSMFSSGVTENLKVTKNLYYILSTHCSQIPILLGSS